MGVYSTVNISRKTAIKRIMSRLLDATNDELSEALFELTKNHVLDNYWVWDEEICYLCQENEVEKENETCKACDEKFS